MLHPFSPPVSLMLFDGAQQQGLAVGGLMAALVLLGGWSFQLLHSKRKLRRERDRRLAECRDAQKVAYQREARLSALVEAIQETVLVLDLEARVVDAHQAHKPLPEGILGDLPNYPHKVPVQSLLPYTLSTPLLDACHKLCADQLPQHLEREVFLSHQAHHIHVALSVLPTRKGELGGILVTLSDVTEARETESQLRIAATAFQTHLGVIITDCQARILKVNQRFTQITGYGESEVLGRNPSMLSAGEHSRDVYQALWAQVKAHGRWEGEIWNRRKGGEVFPEWLTISAVNDTSQAVTHYVATLNDISAHKEAEQEIHRLAFYDPLTGLANRRLFLDRMGAVLRHNLRHEAMGALLFIDLDNFKQVNDTLGHHAGDQLLASMARELSQVLREHDTLARLGGDEFAVLIHSLDPNATATATDAEAIAVKLLSAIRRPIQLNQDTLVITGSIGITLFGQPPPTEPVLDAVHAKEVTGSSDQAGDIDSQLDHVLQQADMALFHAKEAGRDTLSFFDPDMQGAMLKRARLESDLRQASGNGQWRLVYQPQVARCGRTLGAEVLLRWAHPEQGMVSPADFMPLLESTRLINEVGSWVLESACHQLAKWQASPHLKGLTLAVNISPVQFRENRFVAMVEDTLRRSGAPPDLLKLEVTESLFLETPDSVRDKMEMLRAKGVRFSLDDFGTGYSSLAYLAQLPLDQLKIDKSFVQRLEKSPADAAIVESTIALADNLGLAVIAEGVEHDGEWHWLCAHGCFHYQGFLFGRPMPIDDFSARVMAEGG